MSEAHNRPQAADKSGARIADLIQSAVLEGGLRPGHLLGSEPELMAKFGVSRSTLREGVRQLEVHGLVRMRRGSGGGLVVSGSAEGVAARALATYLELIDANISELFEARKILESSAAGLAAERASEADIETLRAQLDRLAAAAPEPGNVGLHVELRDQIGHSSGNPALALFITALNRFTVESIAEQISRRAISTSFHAAVGPKRRIVEAIVAGDRSGAEQATRDDLDVRLALLSKHHGEEASAGARRTKRERTGFEPKMGEAVALRIAHEIARGELAKGQRLGAEPELLARYKVSRAVWREAVRILELHGLARTRRGFGGGLVVNEPDPGYCVKTAVGYLRHSPMGHIHMDEVRRILSIAAAQLAAEHASDDGVSQLDRLYRRQLDATGSPKVEASLAFHLQLADLSGNRAIALLLRVLLYVNWNSPPRPLSSEMEAGLDESHAPLLDAIRRHDPALARRRMVEHVNRASAWMVMQFPKPWRS